MKTINKIILGLILLSGSLMADEVKLAWKGCSEQMMNVMFLLNTFPSVRNNDIQIKLITGTVDATHNDPFFIDRNFYNTYKSIYDSIYIAVSEGVIFGKFLHDLDFNNESIQIQNQLLDGLIGSIWIIDCMEVVK